MKDFNMCKRILLFHLMLVLCGQHLYGATHTVINTNDSGAGSLRQAIIDSNADGVPPRFINFAIPGAGPHTIVLLTSMTPITATVDVNGYTQPGASANTDPLISNAVILIEINGNNYDFANVPNGIQVDAGADGTIIRGLSFTQVASRTIRIFANNCIVSGNFIGWAPDGTTLKQCGRGVQSDFSQGGGISNIFGGPNPADRNVFAPATFSRSCIFDFFSESLQVINNIIGLDKNGAMPATFPGGGFGVFLRSFSPGTPTLVERNVISGNSIGILLQSALGVVIRNNFIGTDVTGLSALPNINGFSATEDAFNLLGGSTPTDRNIIAGNDRGIFSGDVFFVSSFDDRIEGNYIGVNANQQPLGNSTQGISLIFNDTLSATPAVTIANNIIANNGSQGIKISDYSSNIPILGNTIGIAPDGVTSMPNSGNGIQVGTAGGPATFITIGNIGPDRNIIANNLQHGIEILCESNSNTIQNNFIGRTSSNVPAGNILNGVNINNSADNLIGGIAEQGNLIANNRKGVVITESACSPAVGNSILTNSIYANTSLGIDLGDDGITPNDPLDSDASPNRF